MIAGLDTWLIVTGGGQCPEVRAAQEQTLSVSSGASASASLSTPSPLTFSRVLHMTKHIHIDQPWEDDWQVWLPQAQGGSSITGLELNPAVLNHDQLYTPASASVLAGVLPGTPRETFTICIRDRMSRNCQTSKY